MDSLLGGSYLQDQRVSAPTTAFRWRPPPALSHGNGRRGRFSHSPDLQRSTHVSGWTYRTKFHLRLLTSRGCWHAMVSKWRLHGPEGRSRAHLHRRRTSMTDGESASTLVPRLCGVPNDFVVQNAPKQGRQATNAPKEAETYTTLDIALAHQQNEECPRTTLALTHLK